MAAGRGAVMPVKPLHSRLLREALGLVAALPAAALPALAGPPQWLPVSARWCLPTASPTSPRTAAERCIGLEVADDPREQAWGLQLRPPLPPLRGMWFPYDPPTPARFWMHRTPEPLDMLFLRDGRVVAIEARTRPCPRLPCPSYGSGDAVDGVVELAAGEAERLGIGVGSAAIIEPLPPPAPGRSGPASGRLAPARD
jgi:uncharacterized membrane protein (UPF0127 family)